MDTSLVQVQTTDFRAPLISRVSTTLAGTTAITGTTTIANPTITDGTLSRFTQTVVFPLSGAAIHAGVNTAWTAPAAAVVTRVVADITTASTGSSTLDVGYTATTATTSSDTFLDGVSGTPAALFDSMNAALDSGANAKAQKAASAKWITVAEASGDATGLVGNLYISYYLA